MAGNKYSGLKAPKKKMDEELDEEMLADLEMGEEDEEMMGVDEELEGLGEGKEGGLDGLKEISDEDLIAELEARGLLDGGMGEEEDDELMS